VFNRFDQGHEVPGHVLMRIVEDTVSHEASAVEPFLMIFHVSDSRTGTSEPGQQRRKAGKKLQIKNHIEPCPAHHGKGFYGAHQEMQGRPQAYREYTLFWNDTEHVD